MTDNDQTEIALDWRAVTEAASRARQLAGGDRPERAGNGKRRRSPPGPSRARASAEMIAFPLGRRRDFVSRLATQVASRPAEAGELHLLQQLGRQRDVLVRKGIPEKAIEQELRSLRSAIAAELWRLLLGTGA